jgi:hypothetical protein
MRQGERITFDVVTCASVSHYIKQDGHVITTIWRYVFVTPDRHRLIYSGNFLGVNVKEFTRWQLRATMKRPEPAKYGGGWRVMRPKIKPPEPKERLLI